MCFYSTVALVGLSPLLHLTVHASLHSTLVGVIVVLILVLICSVGVSLGVRLGPAWTIKPLQFGLTPVLYIILCNPDRLGQLPGKSQNEAVMYQPFHRIWVMSSSHIHYYFVRN